MQSKFNKRTHIVHGLRFGVKFVPPIIQRKQLLLDGKGRVARHTPLIHGQYLFALPRVRVTLVTAPVSGEEINRGGLDTAQSTPLDTPPTEENTVPLVGVFDWIRGQAGYVLVDVLGEILCWRRIRQ